MAEEIVISILDSNDLEIIPDQAPQIALYGHNNEIEVIDCDPIDIILQDDATVIGNGGGSQTFSDLVVSGDIHMTPGTNQIIDFVDGTTITKNAIGIPGDADFYINNFGAGNGNVVMGKVGSGQVSVNNNFAVTGVSSLTGDVYIGNDLGTEVFVSGFAGSGWKLDKNTDYTLTVDNLYVRKTMNVYELIINQIRSTNGSLWVSDSAKIHSVNGLTCYIDTDSGSIVQPFAVNDIIRCQKWNGRGVKYYSARVSAIDASGAYFTIEIIDGTDSPAAGDEVVRIGNTTDTSRQGALYLTSSDQGAPYMDILDGVTSYSFTNKTVTRLGKLSGITDTDFGGQLSGYGLYSQNVYLKGQIVIAEGSSGYDNITDKPDLSAYALNSQVNALISDLQSQIDGQIMTWFDTYVPSLSNAPASEWTTNTLKDDHLGDLFYNTSTGYGYRFTKVSSVYSWELLSDSDVAAALAAAAAAQDTADGKRRVFITQPTPPYDLGDLWVNGTDLYYCSTAKAEGGSYSASDFSKATNYTNGATWGTNLSNIPATLGTPSGSGLFLSSTHMGYYASSAWKTYLDNAGNFLLGDIAGGNTGLTWSQSAATLTIKGSITATSGVIGNWTINSAYLVRDTGTASTSCGMAPADYPFFAGQTYANRSTAPFRITNQGVVYASSGVIGGWTLASDAIYVTAKSTADGFASSGFTIAANGGIHTPRFYLNSNGNIGIRTNTTGKRIEINSIDNNIKLYNSSGDNVVRIDDTLDDDWPYPGIITSSTVAGSQLYDRGLSIAKAGGSNWAWIEASGSNLLVLLKDLPYASSGVPAGLVTGQLWRDGNNYVRIKV